MKEMANVGCSVNIRTCSLVKMKSDKGQSLVPSSSTISSLTLSAWSPRNGTSYLWNVFYWESGMLEKSRNQGWARPDLGHRDRDQDWKCLSLNNETEIETEKVWVSMTRPRQKRSESQSRDRDHKNIETKTKVVKTIEDETRKFGSKLIS